jgi:hypothetical protein
LPGPLGCLPANRPGVTRDLSSFRLDLPLELASGRATALPLAAVRRPTGNKVALLRFAPLRQHNKGSLGYPPCGGWRIFRIRPGRLQGISPSWRLVGPLRPRPCFRPKPPRGFPSELCSAGQATGPFGPLPFARFRSPPITLAGEGSGGLAPQGIAPGQQLYGSGRLLHRRVPQLLSWGLDL